MSIIGGILSSMMTNVMSSMAIERIAGSAYVSAEIRSLSPSNSPYPLLGGIHTLVLQNNPEQMSHPKFVAEYKEMKALELRNPTMHFVGNERKPFPLNFVLEDHYEGPPHATSDSGGNIIYNGFTDLQDVLLWLEMLATPVDDWGHPPFVKFVWGPTVELGLAKDIHPVSVAMYPNGDLKIVEVSMTIHPEPILVGRDRTHFKVKA